MSSNVSPVLHVCSTEGGCTHDINTGARMLSCVCVRACACVHLLELVSPHDDSVVLTNVLKSQM
jgi:hypothetical protein